MTSAAETPDAPTPRPVDDFRWLPAQLAEFGHPDFPAPARIERELESGRRISALEWGDAPARVVYLHGGGQNAHTWDLVAALVGVPAIAVDLPGHGHSSWRDDKDYRPDTNARAVAEFLDTLDVQPELVVGMSLGGLTTLALAGHRPDLVPELLLIDILPGVEKVTAVLDRDKLEAVALISGPREFDRLEQMEDATIAAAGPRRSPETLKRGVWHNAVQRADGTWQWRYDDLRTHLARNTNGLWESVRNATGPFRLVKGGASPIVSDEAVSRLRQVRPDARIHVVDGVGHSVQSEAPRETAALITEALSGAQRDR